MIRLHHAGSWRRATCAFPLITLLAACQSMPSALSSGKPLSCTELVPEVIKASEQKAAKDPLNWPISSIDDAAPIEPPGDFECNGMARLSNSESVKIVYGHTNTLGNPTPSYKLEEN